MAATEVDHEEAIIEGPGKWSLVVALFEPRHLDPDQNYCDFTVKSGVKIKVKINGVDQEDGSGESWILRGYIVQIGAVRSTGPSNFSAYYDSRRRQGVFRVLKNS